jgi:hypothetical protein
MVTYVKGEVLDEKIVCDESVRVLTGPASIAIIRLRLVGIRGSSFDRV